MQLVSMKKVRYLRSNVRNWVNHVDSYIPWTGFLLRLDFRLEFSWPGVGPLSASTFGFEEDLSMSTANLDRLFIIADPDLAMAGDFFALERLSDGGAAELDCSAAVTRGLFERRGGEGLVDARV